MDEAIQNGQGAIFVRAMMQASAVCIDLEEFDDLESYFKILTAFDASSFRRVPVVVLAYPSNAVPADAVPAYPSNAATADAVPRYQPADAPRL